MSLMKMPIYNLVYGDGKMVSVKVRGSVLLDFLECVLINVRDSNPSSPMYFTFDREDMSLSMSGKTYVAEARLMYSEGSDEMMIGNRAMQEVRSSIRSVFPNISFRIRLSGIGSSR